MNRTMLFLPGNTPNMIVNGGLLGSDRIILDLEDAVSPDQKDAARELVAETLRTLQFPDCQVVVRINGLDTPYWEEDLKAVIPGKPDLIMPPKISGADDIRRLDEAIGELEEEAGLPKGIVKLLPLIETARGVEESFSIASASRRVTGLFLGAEDLTADLKCARTRDGDEIAYARGRLVCAARAAGIEVYDTPFADVEDMEGLQNDARLARSLGFSGKAAINPRQVDCTNEVFSPTEQEIRYASEVILAVERAKEEGKGVVSLKGKMIDAPIVNRAKTVLETAKILGLIKEEGGEEA